MPKQKQLLKLSKKKEKHPVAGPETADDFLAAGVEFEEAGEKWRAGDASKSCRFFTRAIDMYGAGLRRHPHSFDLAYNKARLQYEISQQLRLLEQLPTPLVELLQLAVESHRYALAQKQDDADALFNTAQVLTSLAETSSGGHTGGPTDRENALKAFREALELFQRCLDVQEYQWNEAQTVMGTMSTTPSQGQHEGEESNVSQEQPGTPQEEQWVSIVEPITADTLFDTMIAQIETITAMCGLMVLQDPSGFPWMEEYSNSLFQRMSSFTEGSDKLQELFLSRANFLCAYADASFRVGNADLPTYQRELNSAFSNDQDLSNIPQGLCDRADAFMAFVLGTYSAMASTPLSDLDLTELSDLHWRYLTRALTDLTAATKLPDVVNLPKIHIRRGDCELMRFRLGEAPTLYKQAAQNAALLLKNAETYYRGAVKLAQVEKSQQEEWEAMVKEAVVNGLNGGGRKISELLRRDRARVQAVIEEMTDEGLLGRRHLAILEHHAA
ncbi:hypothetical protein MMC30_008434 [Trapelia coarctata]|nr:hypothetical protein [Trapelia coarctata]